MSIVLACNYFSFRSFRWATAISVKIFWNLNVMLVTHRGVMQNRFTRSDAVVLRDSSRKLTGGLLRVAASFNTTLGADRLSTVPLLFRGYAQRRPVSSTLLQCR